MVLLYCSFEYESVPFEHNAGFFFQHFRQNSASSKLRKFQNSAQIFRKTQPIFSKTQISGKKFKFLGEKFKYEMKNNDSQTIKAPFTLQRLANWAI